ncbi:hypothetical protein [Phytohabitans suffuscus]|uniref:Uncharacterized protein n=1 Tax=Phytohabitans suffuscus TaxID=624315 RepID=A0A6F8YRR5_9ACTN|nr:hypothetical protein [Phytohabitans suffuscus]BCB88840.1 hypothetical protein Psuf_061530 [Phytohabitans suffuscus]
MTGFSPELIQRGFSMERVNHRDELRSALRDAIDQLGRARDDVEGGKAPLPSDLRAALDNVANAYARATALTAVGQLERFVVGSVEGAAIPEPKK